MSKGFRTFQAALNTWDTQLYFPTPTSFLQDWENNIQEAQKRFKATTPTQRAALLLRIASFLQQDKLDIQEVYCRESGLSKERFESEFARLTNTIFVFAEHIQQFSWQKQFFFLHKLPNRDCSQS